MSARPPALLAAAASVVLTAGSPESSREVDNVAAFARLYGVVRYFFPSDAAANLDWSRFAVHGVVKVRPAIGTAALRETLAALFAPLGPGIEIGTRLPTLRMAASSREPLVAWRYLGPGFSVRSEHNTYMARRTGRAGPTGFADGFVARFAQAAPITGDHADFDLGAGLLARVPLALSDSQARTNGAQQDRLDTLTATLAAVPGPSETPDLDQRLADIVVAWGVFRHFYPYWTDVSVDWEACLRTQLESARAARTRAAQRDAIRALVADARDGHGSVADPLDKNPQAVLPIQMILIDHRVVVSASVVPEAPVGAVLSSVDRLPATERLEQAMRLQSGTTQWRQVCALRKLASGPKGAKALLVLDRGAGNVEVTLSFSETHPPPETRPEPAAELERGIWYVDLTRATLQQIQPRLSTLAAAVGLVLDMRGYPSDAGAGILPHLLDGPEGDRWMHVAKLVGPFGRSVGWESFGWDLRPARPRIAGRVVVLTDGRAISYAESVMGYVADHRLATIVGTNTAGTNGNVASFTTPGGFTVNFTGMRVTGHDGAARFHLLGVKPDIAVGPTIEGLRAGRDEVLERGVALVRAAAPPR